MISKGNGFVIYCYHQFVDTINTNLMVKCFMLKKFWILALVIWQI